MELKSLQMPYPQKSYQGKDTLELLLMQKHVWKAEQADAAYYKSPLHSDLHGSPTRHLHMHRADIIPFYIPAIDTLLPEGGLPRNAAHEIFYRDPLQPQAVACTLPTILAYNAWSSSPSSTKNSLLRNAVPNTHPRCHTSASEPHTPRILWIGSQCWPSPLVLSSYGSIDSSHFMQQCIFLAPPNKSITLWAIEAALRSQAVQAVIAACPSISRSTTQRLSILARSSKTTLILLRKAGDLTLASHVCSRWELSPIPASRDLPSWELTLHKLKGYASQKRTWCLSLQDLNPCISAESLDTHALRARVSSDLLATYSEPRDSHLIASSR